MNGRAQLRLGERGFVLPGVVMFVIVLTILGLSLFALSSYEAQFMNRTLDETQAFYLANGAIDRARYLLISTRRLESVAANLGTGVDSAIAIQDPYGTRKLTGVWTNSTDPILVRVTADKNGYRRSLEAQFDPNVLQQYDNLFDMSRTTKGLQVVDTLINYPPTEPKRVVLRGVLWQTYDGPTWHEDIFDLNDLSYSSDRDELLFHHLPSDGYPLVPAPQVAAFISQYFASGAPKAVSGSVGSVSLDAIAASPLDSVAFFRTSGATHNTDPNPNIVVRGRAVWMFDSGFRADRTISVTGSGSDMLILVARAPNPADLTNPGIWLDGGIDSPNVPVIIVSDARVLIANQPSANFNTTVNWMSLYAWDAQIAGPKINSPSLLTFLHVDTPGAEASLERLFQRRALPNVNGPRNSLAYKPGTWRELPTN